MTNKFQALGDKAVASGADQTQAKTGGGGGDYNPPAAGPCRLRFVGYVEVGKQPHTFQGKTTFRDKVYLTFEISGPRHPPVVNSETGETYPHRITIEENLSLSDKAHFYKLFMRMNYAGKARHMVQLLGEAFKGTVIHRKYAKRGEPKDDQTKWTGLAVELFDRASGYTIQPPRTEDPETGELVDLKVEPAKTPLKAFVWEHADMEQWGDIFIEGEYPERKNEKGEVTAPAKSKNVYQNAIKAAKNFEGSPIHQLLVAGGAKLDLPAPGEDPDDVNNVPAGDPTDDIPY
jgi:hypothetical protein